MNKENLITHLRSIAEMFYKAKETYRGAAFGKVASQLQNVDPLTFDKDGNFTTQVRGVGEGIKKVIEEFYQTGTSKKYEDLVKVWGIAIAPRFDARLVKKKISKLLKPLTIDWGFAGSMRRGLPTVKDVDVVVCITTDDERLMVIDILKKAGLEPDIRAGNEKIGLSVKLDRTSVITLDINFTHPKSRGSMYLYFTGSKSFNVAMRANAKRRGLTLNQNGLFKKNKLIASQTEEEIFKALQMDYVSPEDRV